MADDELAHDLVLREWDEAWTQSRHLESMRSQYLGFFFAATLGVVVVTGKQLAEDSLASAGSLITLAALALGLELLSAFLYVAVVRINRVLNYYGRLIFWLKSEVYAHHDPPVDLSAYLMWPQPTRHGWKGRLSTTQGTAELVLILGVCVFPVVLLAALVRAATAPDVASTGVVLCAICLAVGVAAGGTAVWAAAGSGELPRGTALPEPPGRTER